MPNGGELTLKLSNYIIDNEFCLNHPGAESGEYVQFSISDTGEGIPEEHIDNIFNPFFSTKAAGEGTGLGLSMVFGFIKRSAGYLSVVSEIDLGTTINLYLPREKEPISNEIRVEHLPASIDMGKETLMLVDDETALLEISKDMLESAGYKVYTASSGTQALKTLEEQPNISLLISDIIMPGGINGYQLAEACRTKYPEIKILLCSGYNNARDVGEIPAIENLLRKPYNLKDLTQKVRNVLDTG